MNLPNIDDKDLVIIAALIIAIGVLIQLPNRTDILGQIITGLFGIAVGRNKNGA